MSQLENEESGGTSPRDGHKRDRWHASIQAGQEAFSKLEENKESDGTSPRDGHKRDKWPAAIQSNIENSSKFKENEESSGTSPRGGHKRDKRHPSIQAGQEAFSKLEGKENKESDGTSPRDGDKRDKWPAATQSDIEDSSKFEENEESSGTSQRDGHKRDKRLASIQSDSEDSSSEDSSFFEENEDSGGTSPRDGHKRDKRLAAIKQQQNGFRKAVELVSELAEDVIKRKGREHFARYRPLVRALSEEDVKAVEDFIRENRDTALLDDEIDDYGQTIFHVTGSEPVMHGVLEKLLLRAQRESLERQDTFGYTALHWAVSSGNLKAIQLFVQKNKKLLTMKDNFGDLPVDDAVTNETVNYMLFDSDAKIDELAGKTGARLLLRLIDNNKMDVAFRFLKSYEENLARRHKNSKWDKTINVLARKDTALSSRSRLGYLQKLIYQLIPVKVYGHFSKTEGGGDLENQIRASGKTNFFADLQNIFWNALMLIVPGVKSIHDQKLMHKQTFEIVRIMVGNEMLTLPESLKSLKKPLLTAAKLGNWRFVREISKVCPRLWKFVDKHGHNIFHVAVLHRQEEVLNLMIDLLHANALKAQRLRDDTKCNILHLAGRLVPSTRVPGATLQMQREMQWFKAIEDVCEPYLQEQRNFYGEKPRDVFTKEHKELVKEGEKWMKGTATSCSVVGALIITVAFTTAFALPGGINDEGIPKFLSKTSFKIFLVSNALALFSATASVQMFLGILTSRYAEQDFLQSLPNKLIAGLVALFFSIASMMVAFASTLQIYLHQPWKSVTFLTASLGSVPVTLFALMEFPLLVDIVTHTYGFSVLKPKKPKK